MPLVDHGIEKRIRGSAKLQKREGAIGRAIAKVLGEAATFPLRNHC